MLRDFQIDMKNRIYAAWQEPNVFNIIPVLPTGAGKTVLFCNIVSEYQRPSRIIAHRQELIAQASLKLNREGVTHGIDAPKPVISEIVKLHHELHNHSLYSHRSDVRVCSVDSLKDDPRAFSVGLVVIDEGHHVLRGNKWGRAMQSYPNARGLFPTAHALRADSAGLGRDADGLADELVLGPTAREVIDRGFLTDYKIYCPSTDIDFSDVPIGSTGDYSLPQLRSATHKSNRLVGDVVRHYRAYAEGELGITFAVDVESAKDIANAYAAQNIPAHVITAKTPLTVRVQLMRQFRRRQILQLVSVDCLGEGVDVPAVRVVSLARKTASFQLFAQQTGRSLRVDVEDSIAEKWGEYTDAERLMLIEASKKPNAIIIDHVGNVGFHGLPDVRKSYTLDREESRSRSRRGDIQQRICNECTQPYERILLQCPHCGAVPEPPSRSTPEAVDGDLVLLEPEVCAAMRADVERLLHGVFYPPTTVSAPIQKQILKNHQDRVRGLYSLRSAMELWGGWRIHVGEPERVAQKRFYAKFGIDVLTALTLSSADASELEIRVRMDLERNNIVEAVK